ncbi:hypothetical protein L1987_21993 [Smallanthus sonchifolius]|uniref:Uncharacterized protein n=1 Tax=Smallanthus sonchifolius TaxID=185202 RepID=A0ACB9IF34_9ASTR|nr:hypothetical protein L1987_21993 [Smallanthus sonchifolius]
MIGRRFISFLRRNPSLSSNSPKVAVEEAKPKSWGRRIVSGGLICVTGGVALSALDDLIIYQSCSSKAMEKASKNQAVINAIGEPISRGSWYNASLAVTHKRHSVSCTFPVSRPHGTGIFQLRAVRSGEESWLSFFRPRDWEILIMFLKMKKKIKHSESAYRMTCLHQHASHASQVAQEVKNQMLLKTNNLKPLKSFFQLFIQELFQ